MVLLYSTTKVYAFAAFLAIAQLQHANAKPSKRKYRASLDNKKLPWKDLLQRLSPQASLIEASNEDFANQCDAGLEKDIADRRDDIIDAESGLCMDSFVCGYQQCLPTYNKTATVAENLRTLYQSQAEDLEQWKDPGNPNFGLPASTLFVKTAGDIIAAVEFANDNRLELSVKSSGHNYSGQSSKKDTLLVNTRRFQKYAQKGVVECDAGASSTILSDLSNQPCVLALARNKEAYIRVATGESFGEAYGIVHDFNEAQDEYKYHLVGGATPTVTPMGWTFSGGMAATTMGRHLGYGVDQVLMIEAVLPTGEFVRFGPTSFEDAEGFRIPKTTAVSGVCNQNPFDDEASWTWGPCKKDINFDDLWFAFRGGGGGTFGIATSVFLQLHDYKPLNLVTWLPDTALLNKTACNVREEDYIRDLGELSIRRLYTDFANYFLIEPEKVGVSKEESSVCGTPQLEPPLHCYGDGAGHRYAHAWREYLEKNRELLVSEGISNESIDEAGKCLDSQILEYKDYLEYIGDGALRPTPFPNSAEFGTVSDYMVPAIVVPYDLYAQNRDFWLLFYGFDDNQDSSFYHVVGGDGVNHAHDQTTSLPKNFRNAAFYTSISPELPFFQNTEFRSYAPEVVRDGYLAPNHMHPHAYGTLKSDPTQVCDFETFTFEEAEEKCRSPQQAIWGDETLARLEKIKKTVDPNHILNCYRCVGYKNNRFKKTKKKKASKSSKNRRVLSSS